MKNSTSTLILAHLEFLECWKDAEIAVYLIPARTDTRWFHEICLPFAKEIRFIMGRLRFGDGKYPAPFPSMLVIFEQAHARA